jgi:hypothetical protein
LLEIERLFETRRALFQVGGQEGAQIRLVRAWNKGDHLGQAFLHRSADHAASIVIVRRSARPNWPGWSVGRVGVQSGSVTR